MPRITEIRPAGDRVYVYLDGVYAQSIRARTFAAMNLSVGQVISKDELEEMEKNHWKIVYGPASWEAEKTRLSRVSEMLTAHDDRISVSVTGFGADSVEMIDHHPAESGKPDLSVHLVGVADPITTIEVTGTDFRRGNDYWVRPDKLAYAQRHPDEDVWIVLHYSKPNELVVAIKPDPSKRYVAQRKTIRKSIELFVVFNPSDSEVHDFSVLVRHIRQKVDHRTGSR